MHLQKALDEGVGPGPATHHGAGNHQGPPVSHGRGHVGHLRAGQSQGRPVPHTHTYTHDNGPVTNTPTCNTQQASDTQHTKTMEDGLVELPLVTTSTVNAVPTHPPPLPPPCPRAARSYAQASLGRAGVVAEKHPTHPCEPSCTATYIQRVRDTGGVFRGQRASAGVVCNHPCHVPVDSVTSVRGGVRQGGEGDEAGRGGG